MRQEMRHDTRHRGIVWIAATALIAVLAQAAVARAQSKSPEEVYKQRCASCHGTDGKPSPVGKSVGARDWTTSASLKGMKDADLSKIIKEGKGKMPKYPTLSAEQIASLVKIIRAFATTK